MKVIIAGSRDMTDMKMLKKAILLSKEHFEDFKIDEVVNGKAKGADRMGEKFAILNKITMKEFPADWDGDGKAAGYRRNTRMAEYGDFLIALWDGKSPGTKHMISEIRQLNKIGVVVLTNGDHSIIEKGDECCTF